MTPETNPEQLLHDLCQRDTRYPFEAYEFIYAALGYVQHQLKTQAVLKEVSQPVTGQQISEGFRDFALQEFGLMAGTVLKTWNINSTDDIGELFYNLVEFNLITKSDTDSKADFHDVYNMSRAFSEGFQFTMD